MSAALSAPSRLSRIGALPRWLRIVAGLAALAALPYVYDALPFVKLSDSDSLIVLSATVYAAAALSLNILLGYTGQISLAQFTVVGVGAFADALLTNPDKGDLPFLVALPLAGLIAGAFGMLIGLPALRLRGVTLAIATIGIAFIGDDSLFRLPFLGGSAGIVAPPPYVGTHRVVYLDYFALALVVLGLLWVLDANIARSKVGRAFQGVRANEHVAASYGVNTGAYTLLAFTVAGFIAGIAGAIHAPTRGTVLPDSFGYDHSLILVALVVIGGVGSRLGAVTAAFVFWLFPSFLHLFWSAGDVDGIATIVGGFFLILTLALHPGGIADAMRERREKRLAKARGVDDLVTGLPALPRPRGLDRPPSVAPTAALLEVRDVVVRFGGLTAVDHASFTVTSGTICALVGPNGAGKSTLFDVVCGLRRPETGQVVFARSDITHLAPHARAALGIGRTFQQIGLAPDLSVTENLLLAQHTVADYSVVEALLAVGRAPRAELAMRERAREAVAALGFERYANTPVKHLSQGQRRIVEIGATLVTAPELVLLDEPSAGFSPAAAEALAVRLADIRDELGRTVLLIEHNMPLVLDVADELVVLDAGAIVADGEPAEVVSRPEVVEAYLGRGYDEALAAHR